MAHILGLEHSLSGIAGQIGSVFGGISTGFGAGFGGPPALPPPPNFPAVPGGSPGFGGPINGGGTTATEVIIDNATGRCISVKQKKHRRRRKRLATKSDIADLAALKAILGPKALMSYIATYGGR